MNELDKKAERLSNIIINSLYDSNYSQEIVDLAYNIQELLHEKNKKTKAVKKIRLCTKIK